jgi:hypothetical protein
MFRLRLPANMVRLGGYFISEGLYETLQEAMDCGCRG